jgi:hypothetical protein
MHNPIHNPVRIDFSNLKGVKWPEYAVRFLLGGAITAAAGLLAKGPGPVVAGLFLAFPAILPATVTLVAKHQREKKEQKGMLGDERARDVAALDTNGAELGSLGMVAFAVCVYLLLPRIPAVGALLIATVAWCVVSATAWVIRRSRHVFTARKRARLHRSSIA